MGFLYGYGLVVEYFCKSPHTEIVESGDVLNYTTCVMQLTRGKLLQQDNWSNWKSSEYLQLDQ
jgi:hypothetical protein